MTRSYSEKNLSVLMMILYSLFLLSVVFVLRAITSISIGVILAVTLADNKIRFGKFFQPFTGQFFLAGCILLYLLELVALSYADNTTQAIKHLRLYIGIVIVPLAVCNTAVLNLEFRKKLMSIFTGFIFIGTVYCYASALIKYSSGADNSVFFYHLLVSPIFQHAIQFSILVFLTLIFLLESLKQGYFILNKFISSFLVVYFSIFLFLLSSKLVLIVYVVYIFYYIFTLIQSRVMGLRPAIFLVILLIASGSFLIVSDTPVSKRFREISTGSIEVVSRDKFSEADYFNGLQFRLLQWRNVIEILNKEKKWLLGVSPGDAQNKLDEKYKETGMYTGKGDGFERGFLGYNTHNQFLQSLLQTGLPGLLIFLFICMAMIRMIYTIKNTELSFTVILLLAFSLTESVLESQYSLIIFTFFPVFAYRCLVKTLKR